MKSKDSHGINVGSSLILVTFVLLCLITFSVLAFITVRSDANLSIKSADRIKEYYEAYGESEEIINSCLNYCSDAYNHCADEEDYYNTVNNDIINVINNTHLDYNKCCEALTVTKENDGVRVEYYISYSANRLHVIFKCVYSDIGIDVISRNVE